MAEAANKFAVRLLIFGVIAGAVGGLVFQVAIILFSGNRSLSRAVFSLSLLFFTIPAGVLIGLLSGLVVALVLRLSRSHGILGTLALVGIAAFVTTTICTFLIGSGLSVGPPPFWVFLAFGAISGILFAGYYRSGRET